MITRDSIDKIFDAVRIEEVVGDFIQLKKAGSNFKGLSPWTNEKTPSFFVSPSKGIFKDFSSGKGGNAVSFLMELENMTYPEALKYLADKYQIEIEETQEDGQKKEETSLRESLTLVNQYAFEYFSDTLWNTENGKAIGLSYFRERGFTDQTIKTFGLGYSLDQNDSFYKAALEAGHNEEHLLKLGLIKEGEYGKYDFFRGRVIFPIRNLSGRPIAFAGRTLRSDNKVKYLNSPESELYDKSNSLYGIYEAKRSIIKEDLCCLTEGYTDVLSLHQAGIPYTVASSGTSLTEGQIKLIKRYTSNVTLLYDGDSAGVKAALRGINLLLEQGMNVKVVLFPEGHDPDSFARSVSTTELEAHIRDQALDFSDFMLQVLLEGTNNDPVKKASATRDLIESIALIKDHIARSIYVERASKTLGIPEQALYNELNKTIRKKQLKRSGVDQNLIDDLTRFSTPQKPEKAEHDPEIHEREITRILLNYGQKELELELDPEESEVKDEEVTSIKVAVAEYILHHIIEDEIIFHSPIYARIIDTYRNHFEEEGSFPHTGMLVNDPDPKLSEAVAGMISSPYELSVNWAEKHYIFTDMEDEDLKRTVFDPLMRLKLTKVRILMSEVEAKIKSVQSDEELDVLLHEKMRLDKMKTEISEFFGSAIL